MRLSLYSPNAGDCTADFSCGPSNVGNYWYNESDGRWYETPPRPDYGEWNWSNPAPDRKQRELNDYRQEVLEREQSRAQNDLYNRAKRWIYPRDPLILDLDGDGLETLGLSSHIHFDHNGDGVLTGTGWVGGGDALLVWDRNANGRIDTGAELFGDFTPLPNGTLAPNGFAALAALDANGDGVIDASDPAFAQLRLWRDASPEGGAPDGLTGEGELISLAEAGIVALDLAHTLR
ncbi:MAG: hypothetical protein KA603_12960, partial [Azonexus sp.]|nr:hypothetical protein [Azonexus sp.]